MRLSAIVPTLNAEAHLPSCLAALAAADEILVVDGGSHDATRKIAQSAGAQLIESPPGRGIQLAAGAAAATGDWLLFVHADTRLAPGWRGAAESHARAWPGAAAAFRFTLDDDAPQARVIEAGARLRGRLGLPYGDQGLLISRSLYDALGGFRPLALMEDVDLARRLGRRRLMVLPCPAITSAERWRRDGWFARSTRNLFCLAAWSVGVDQDRLAGFYR